ncbi:FAD/NAD(P)-binding protein [Methyloceanibacter sp.]|uniref:FAD/NAD(P)-binding protein n=1 Tax=Methyloceanibacter sp. TaxID=1965321 RepID=UPI002D40DD8E|nr:FAD/NAD(P)-binding protein [Methyloceanibacter sp.]HZP10225.1 FAD/NAD(P)-binding protein [Methyloceanibacter sp.]
MRAAPLTVGVIGGGFTGAASAIACLARFPQPFRLVIIEPSAVLGRGVAYGSHHPLHLLNVRTRDLSVRADRPGDFLNWAFRQLDQGENHDGLHEALAHTFLPRQLFGEYVRQRLFEMIEQRPDVEFSVKRAVARAIHTERGGYVIELERGRTVPCDAVIVATAYGVQGGSSSGALSPYEALPPDLFARAQSIALIGSGLTMVDVLISARREGFQGTATIVSRRGQLPRPHAPKGVVPHLLALPRSKHVSMLEASLRIACELAEEGGTPWQAVINGLRASLQDIWQELPVAEQARFLRHLRPFFDAHRHRLPAEIHARLMNDLDKGRAVLLRGSVMGVERAGEGFRLEVMKRGAATPEIMEVDLAFDCSGFKPDLDQPLLRGMIEKGLARPDPHRLGLAVEANGQVLGRGGEATRGVFAVGPLCQGTLWEITAVPEIVRQADAAALSLAALQEPVRKSGTVSA